MVSSPSPGVKIPTFIFRVTVDEVEDYRRALGLTGHRVPYGIALRALANDSVAPVLREIAQHRHLVHVAQHYTMSRPLSPGIDYRCDVHVQLPTEGRLRIEQELSDPSGQTCLILASEIMVVAT